jgi:hypothetical protein
MPPPPRPLPRCRGRTSKACQSIGDRTLLFGWVVEAVLGQQCNFLDGSGAGRRNLTRLVTAPVMAKGCSGRATVGELARGVGDLERCRSSDLGGAVVVVSYTQRFSPGIVYPIIFTWYHITSYFHVVSYT